MPNEFTLDVTNLITPNQSAEKFFEWLENQNKEA